MNSFTVFLLLSMIYRMESLPNVCKKEGKLNIDSFNTLTQMVNDSYMLSDRDRLYIIDNVTVIEESKSLSSIKSGSGQTLASHDFRIDSAFVIDIDGQCVNVEEILFASTFVASSNQNKYVYYTNHEWSDPKYMNAKDVGLEALNKINDKMKIFNSKTKAILYFHSFGLLVIKDKTQSALAYCSPEGWRVTTNPIDWKSSQININHIDTGFVDNDQNMVYLFEELPIEMGGKHPRAGLHQCSYILGAGKISFDCQKKSLDDFCLKEKPNKMNWTKIVALIALICVVVVIAIVFVAIIALICLPQREDPSSATSGSLKTMDDKASQPVLPNTSLTTQNN